MPQTMPPPIGSVNANARRKLPGDPANQPAPAALSERSENHAMSPLSLSSGASKSR